MDHHDSLFEMKVAPNATGEFEGYASVFGGLDSHRDRIMPGAFQDSLTALRSAGRSLPMYFQHGARTGADPRPVGVWTAVEEDHKGLRVAGRLVALDTETGRYNQALVRDGAMRGLSIGFNVPTGGAVFGKSANEPRRTLTRLNLAEISVVDTPSDPAALITSVKLADRGDLEMLLRSGGLSKAAAVKIVAGGWTALAGPDESDLTPSIQRLAERLDAALGDLKSLKG